jgi:hypothetical protein
VSCLRHYFCCSLSSVSIIMISSLFMVLLSSRFMLFPYVSLFILHLSHSSFDHSFISCCQHLFIPLCRYRTLIVGLVVLASLISGDRGSFTCFPTTTSLCRSFLIRFKVLSYQRRYHDSIHWSHTVVIHTHHS